MRAFLPLQFNGEKFANVISELRFDINKLLYARVTAIDGLKVKITCEVTCVAYRQGSATKAYRIAPYLN